MNENSEYFGTIQCLHAVDKFIREQNKFIPLNEFIPFEFILIAFVFTTSF